MKLLERMFRHVEKSVLVATLALITVIPLVEVFGPKLAGVHVPGAATYVKHLTLWLAFVGGLAAATQAKHLTLSTAEFLGKGVWRRLARLLAYSVSAAVVAILAYASAQVVKVNAIEPKPLAFGLDQWMSETIMPVSLALMAIVFAWKASDRWWGRLAAFLAIPLAFSLGWRARRVWRRASGRSPS